MGVQAASLEREKAPISINLYGIVLYISGTTTVYLFLWERVPLTGRKRLSWLWGSSLREPDELDRLAVEKLRRTEKI